MWATVVGNVCFKEWSVGSEAIQIRLKWNDVLENAFALESTLTHISEWSKETKGGNTTQERFSEVEMKSRRYEWYPVIWQIYVFASVCNKCKGMDIKF